MRLMSRENALCSAQSESWVSHTKTSERVRAGLGSRGTLKGSLAAFHDVHRGVNPFGNDLLQALQRALKHKNCPQRSAQSTRISWMVSVAADELLWASASPELAGQSRHVLAAAGTAMGPERSILAFPSPRVLVAVVDACLGSCGQWCEGLPPPCAVHVPGEGSLGGSRHTRTGLWSQHGLPRACSFHSCCAQRELGGRLPPGVRGRGCSPPLPDPSISPRRLLLAGCAVSAAILGLPQPIRQPSGSLL